MRRTPFQTRRTIMAAGAVTLASTAFGSAFAQTPPLDPRTLSPNEDLMQEHSLVGRIILIYRRCIDNIEQAIDFDPDVLIDAASMVAHVIHGHHELEEEQILFPIVQRRQELAQLVSVLVGQHQAARGLTGLIANTATHKNFTKDANQRGIVLNAMREFASMYEPHGVYEDTIVYPAFREALSPQEYTKYTKVFAQEELRMNGTEGFERRSAELSRIERTLGLSLAMYTEQIAPLRKTDEGIRRP